MHKQFLSTAFASILALAILSGVITPEAKGEIPPETSYETTDLPEETFAPETEAPSAETESETEQVTEPETEPEPEETKPEEEDVLLAPTLPEGATSLSLYINGRAIGKGFAFQHEGKIWLPIEGFCALFSSGNITGEAGKCYIESGDRLLKERFVSHRARLRRALRTHRGSDVGGGIALDRDRGGRNMHLGRADLPRSRRRV